MARIAITGGSFHGNSGAEAMLVTTIARLREAIGDVEFGVLSPYFSDDRVVFQDTREIRLLNSSPLYLALVIFPCSLLLGVLRLIGLPIHRTPCPIPVKFLASCDLLVDIAGVSFIDGRKKFLPYNALSIYPAFLLGKPVIKFAQAIGPIKHWMNRLVARPCLEKCSHVFARGEQTFGHLKEFGLSPDKFTLAPDIAFLHKESDACTERCSPETMEGLSVFLSQCSGPKIGICPSSVLYRGENGRAYLDLLVSLIRDLGAKGIGAVVFPNATKNHRPKTLRNNDLPLLALLKQLAGETSGVHFIETDLNASDVRKIIRTVDLVVVSRFHAMIFALLENCPPLVISWSHKYREVMDFFSLGDLVTDRQSTNPSLLLAAVETALSKRPALQEQIKNRLPTVQTQAKTQIDAAVNLIKSRRP